MLRVCSWFLKFGYPTASIVRISVPLCGLESVCKIRVTYGSHLYLRAFSSAGNGSLCHIGELLMQKQARGLLGTLRVFCIRLSGVCGHLQAVVTA